MVNSAMIAADFSAIAFPDQKETVSRIAVTKTTDFYGDENFSDAAPANIEAIYSEVPKNNDFWNQFGLVKGRDGIIYVLPATILVKNDKIIANSKTYRVGVVTDRRRGNQFYYKVAPLFFIDE